MDEYRTLVRATLVRTAAWTAVGLAFWTVGARWQNVARAGLSAVLAWTIVDRLLAERWPAVRQPAEWARASAGDALACAAGLALAYCCCGEP